MDTKTLTKGIPDSTWQELAESADIGADDLRQRYEAALEAHHPGGLHTIEVERGEPVKEGDCIRRDFDVSLFKIVGLKGYVEFCGSSGSDWTAKFRICLTAAGSEVWCTEYTLSPTNTSICYHPDLTAVKATLCIGVVGTNHCFNIRGEACYWAFGWHCAKFDENLFCFG